MDSLQDHFLIAMPSMKDGIFERSVIYICEHNNEGAMGIIINLPVNISVDELLSQTVEADLDDETASPAEPKTVIDDLVFKGGPVSEDRGFVLHTAYPGFSSSLQINDELMITSSLDVLATLGTKKQPENYIVALGYSGWTKGQLEQEIADNSWLTINADENILFKVPVHKRWEQAVQKIGIDVSQLSSQVGHS
ncbi:MULTISPECIES: YqgE/AlgH family protein [unclassified Moritella]|uniref:YqgE/AlgH family protein n=1 Tax=unclassified Moritella TaxID=2637987 RepID=UPI001BA8C367|nr:MULTISPECIES: YqgE/AlgH family protein [unclassified Moritella]QUM83733.1 YqgE/AlgH family protein [Moritella sp. 28]QUM88025.1 YqgE/AlgH family protein [Moritella sp. 36]